MPNPIDADELELVRRAIILGHTLGGCCEWHKSAIDRLAHRPPHSAFTLKSARQALCAFVREHPEAVIQVAERRTEYPDRKFYYKVILPVTGLQHGLFFEIALDDPDPDYPVVIIVNAHEQLR